MERIKTFALRLLAWTGLSEFAVRGSLIAEEAHAALLRGEQVATVISYPRPFIIGNVCCAAALTATAWGSSVQWFAVIWATLIFAAAAHIWMRRYHRKLRNGGKTALTRWTVLQRFGLASFVEARLETGRTHQIRVHFAAVKHPVVGDPLYGGRVRKSLSLRQAERSLIVALLRTLRRQALHAAELEFVHPVSGERLHFESALPEDMAHALTLLQAFVAERNP